MTIARTSAIALACALLAADAGRAQSAQPAHASGHQGPPAPLVLSIPSTTSTITLVHVPAGTVDPDGPGPLEPQHVEAFYVATTELTWDVYDVYLYALDTPAAAAPGSAPTEQPPATPRADAVSRPSKPYIPPDRGFGHAGYPAIGITDHAAREFCRWLAHTTGRATMLPTEMQWQRVAELAAASTKAPLHEAAWERNDGIDQTQPVGMLASLGPGVHDIIGNVAEWAIDSQGMPVVCGGSYMESRDEVGPGHRARYQGMWQMSDPQFPKSQWWLSDAPFVGLRVVIPADHAGMPVAHTPTQAEPQRPDQPPRP